MTDKTIMRKILIMMAPDAETHSKLLRHGQPIRIRDIAMAFAAVETRLNMRLMAEKYKVRQIKNTVPFYWSAIIIVLAKPGNLRMMNNYLAVAENTRFERRDSGMIGINCI